MHLRLTAVFGSLLLAACASGSAAPDPTTPTPAPAPGETATTPAPEPPKGGRGPAVEYKPLRNAAFRLERHDSLDLQFEGGASQQQSRDRVAFLSVSIAKSPSPGEYGVTIVLDSLEAQENGLPVPPDSLLAARGTRWSATLTPRGLFGLRADRNSTLGDEIQGRLRFLFPAIPAGGVRQGMEWTDTTRYRLVADAFPGTEQAIVTYKANDGESASGNAIELASEGSYSRSGTRTQGEQELQMTASGEREGTHLLSMDGLILSARGTDSGEMTISVPALGQTVPVKQSGTYTVTAITPSSR